MFECSDDVIDILGKPNVIGWFPTGSVVICNPPPTDTDYDIVVFIDKNVHLKANDSFPFLSMEGYLDLTGWKQCNYSQYRFGKNFVAYRKGYFNLIIVWEAREYKGWQLATDMAREKNLLDKNDRVELFEDVRDKVRKGVIV
jgi:hypothetical protein